VCLAKAIPRIDKIMSEAQTRIDKLLDALNDRLSGSPSDQKQLAEGVNDDDDGDDDDGGGDQDPS